MLVKETEEHTSVPQATRMKTTAMKNSSKLSSIVSIVTVNIIDVEDISLAIFVHIRISKSIQCL